MDLSVDSFIQQHKQLIEFLKLELEEKTKEFDNYKDESDKLTQRCNNEITRLINNKL